MSRPSRKPYSATEKVAILRRHLVEQVPVSDLCEQYQLQNAGLIGRRAVVPSRKGRGFEQPLRPQEHWHVDVS